jgi:hypothetical protein
MLQQPEDETRAAFLCDGAAQYRRVEGDCTVKFDDGDINPDDAVAHLILLSSPYADQ